MKPVVQICGYKNSGKTTLLSSLLRIFNGMNISTAVIKHDLHGFEGDVEDTDTYKLRSAGAAATAITSPWRTAVVEERETPLHDLIERFQSYDLILVEGFKQESYPKIVLLHTPEDLDLIHQVSGLIALVVRRDSKEGIGISDNIFINTLVKESEVLVFYADEVRRIAEFILTRSEN
ncbi:molybdopterin-guanine dinucleotide biosynthesis protein B [Fontibacillus phaseoli]|uniref:Molybdopterin-guanine dinucleotide biosynthesis protein B n=1 Tax=Fontibacillus phaseoli TaxID=1416533 RepID=A0A369BPP0_9BACL|nr:molybdopterin-guanine dinucleotide biosynthesis protein B [Fontibacillus phaseoli]RCX23592.1 molybdopterin-guanine dinucleotide biosynthesis protein B [Fontibacillus phaseoli]